MKRRVLAIFDDCGPGDAFSALFALEALRLANPDAELVVVAGEQALPVIQSAHIADRVVKSRLYVPFRRQILRERLDKVGEALALVRQLGFGYDLAVTFFWGTLALNALAFLVARRRIGYVNRLRFLQSKDIGAYDPLRDSVAQNVALLAACGVAPPAERLAPAPRTRADDEAVGEMLSRHAIHDHEAVALFHTGSDWACQQWDIASWAVLADAVIDLYRVQVVWTGTETESSYIEQVRRRMRHRSVSMCGQTATLGELGALSARASICVSVDSLPWEVAAAAGPPVVVLSGPTAPSPRLVAAGPITVVNRTRHAVRRTIVACQATFQHGRCHDYSCPLSQLRPIKVEAVLQRIADTGALRERELEAASR